MKHTYSLQLIARILIVGLFLQGCHGFGNTPLSGIEEQNKQPDIQAILDKEFVAEGGHLVTFYNEKDEIKASLQVNPLDEKNKFYNGVDVIIEKGAELASLAKLDKKTQQKRIQIQFSKEQKGNPENVVVHKSWLMGGGNEGGNGDGSPRAVIMFCGNPGVGKSTLCNSVFGKAVFNSGISVGTGMTIHKQEYMHENKLYIDTPGLRDVEKAEQAALEIEAALKKNNNYKIVFVATLDEGRIRADDLVTINKVCDAIKSNFEYGLIFNKITKKTVQKIEQTGFAQETLYRYLTPLKKKPALTIILTRDEEIEGEDNMYFQSGDENRRKLLEFINFLNANRIWSNNVDKLDVTDYEKQVSDMKERYDREIAVLNRTIEGQQSEIKKLKEKDCVLF